MALKTDVGSTYVHPSEIQCNAASEISSLKSSVSNGKTLVANAITDKGVATSPSDTFATMAANIAKLSPPEPVLVDTISFTAYLSAAADGSYGYEYRSNVSDNEFDYAEVSIYGTTPSEQRLEKSTPVYFTATNGRGYYSVFFRSETTVNIIVAGAASSHNLTSPPSNMRPVVTVKLYKNP